MARTWQSGPDDLFAELDHEHVEAAPRADITLNDDQTSALDTLASWTHGPKDRRWHSLLGAAGTGKTTVLRHARAVIGDAIWTAMTGKAASRMRAAAGVPATTLHKALYGPPRIDEDRGTVTFETLRQPPYGRTLVVDEASMITPTIAGHLATWVAQYGIRVLLVGDGYQLPPVITREEIKAGIAEDYTIFEHHPAVTLTKVMRNGDSILVAATQLRQRGTLPNHSAPTPGYEFVPDADPMARAVQAYLADPEDHALITWTNAARMNMNQAIRHQLGYGATPTPAVGERLLVCKNSHGILNGEVYEIADRYAGDPVGPVPTWHFVTTCGQTIFAHGYNWDGVAPYLEDRDAWKAYRRAVDRRVQAFVRGDLEEAPEPVPVTYGYVLTAHKAQGSEYRRVTTVVPKRDLQTSFFHKPTRLPNGGTAPLSARWLYTALTRARTRSTMLIGT